MDFLLRFCLAIFFCAYVEAQISQSPFFASDDPTSIPGSRFNFRPNGLTYAAVKDISIRPFRKRPPSLQYQVILDEDIFNITLRQNIGLTSPGCLVHLYELNGQKRLYSCNRHKLDCYYTGKSDSHNDSWVAANICNGLRGVLSIGNSSYFFDPMNSNSSIINEGHVHTVYRFQGGKQVCAVDDSGSTHIVHNTRQKRDVVNQVADTKFVETRVVIDPKMVLYHGGRDNVEHYAYMAFNIANKVFKHRSLGQDVQLLINEFHIIEPFNDFASNLTQNASHSLRVFCDWQKQLANKVDANLLLTRINIQDKGSSSVTGLSYTKGMCNNNGNCALVEDQGPIVGITIAHEFGHLLGMNHDTAETGFGIMSPGGWTGNEAFEWSNTSAMDFYSYATLPSDPLKCLRNSPSGRQNKKDPLPPPGLIISADKQCKLMYNKKAYFVSNNNTDVCQQLYCAFPPSDKIIYISASPLVDGTDCYNNRSWCMSGRCVPIDAQHAGLPAIDGEWSEWSDYTPCSRTCGGGVQIKRRRCNNPLPQFGGKDCPGNSTRAKICNLKSCNFLGEDDRMKQCKSISKAGYDTYCNNGVGSNTCYFGICPKGTNSNCRRLMYESGTECRLSASSYYSYSRCVEGQCRNFGCDGISESKIVYDVCGVCNGTGVTCDKHSGEYKKEGIYRVYADVVTIPQNSSNIKVVQKNRFCFLSALMNGTRILNDNGHKGISFTKVVFGVTVRYLSMPEKLEIISKTPIDIDIQVYRRYGRQYNGVSPDVTYTYYTKKPVPMQYAWAIIRNDTCSKECGTGEESDDIKCMNVTGDFVNDLFCGIENRPHQVSRLCNTHECPPRWQVTPWSNCTVPCGIGNKNRNVSCVVDRNGKTEEIPQSNCQHLKHPSFQSTCYMHNCTGNWVNGSWSECSKTCGEGYKIRNVTCAAKYDNHLYALMDNECKQDHRPPSMARCNHGPCYVIGKPGETCRDFSKKCHELYEMDVLMCDGYIKTYMSVQCKGTCGICSNTTCFDQPECDAFKGTDCTKRTNVSQMIWLFQNCPQTCGLCDAPSRCNDDDICVKYDSMYCADKRYIRWMYRNCPQSCGVCRDCTDCGKYDLKYCTDPASFHFMRKYCSKSCGFCV